MRMPRRMMMTRAGRGPWPQPRLCQEPPRAYQSKQRQQEVRYFQLNEIKPIQFSVYLTP